jgi:hypothetical protein
MKKMQEKSKIYNIYVKVPIPPSNQAIWMANTNLQTQEGSKKSIRFLNAKNHIPPETKANHKLPLKLRQIKSSANSTKDTDFP